MDRKTALLIALVFGVGWICISCAGMQTKPTEANFKTPVVSLETVQVTQYNGFWYYDGKVTPTKGKAGANRHACRSGEASPRFFSCLS